MIELDYGCGAARRKALAPGAVDAVESLRDLSMFALFRARVAPYLVSPGGPFAVGSGCRDERRKAV